ncbi:MAG: FtsX-like permease family protein [Acutalibacteraceae bacterium]|nr:FtsX-like permease family protein [Acutalibacteraceae bacterium]
MFKIRLVSFLRDLWQTKTRFFSIFAIVAIGVGFFAGVKATEPDMRESVSNYYSDSRLTHFIISSPLGFDLDDIEQIKTDLGNRMHNDAKISATGGYSEDNLIYGDTDNGKAVKVMNYDRYFNTLTVVEGSLPKAENECAIIAENTKLKLKIGDKITFNDSSLLEQKKFTVTATVKSPLYMSKMQFGTTNIGSGSLSGVVFVAENAFKKVYYNRVYIFDKYLSDRVYYTEGFDNAYDRLKTQVEAMCDEKYAQFTDQTRTDYTGFHLDVISSEFQKQAEKLNETYNDLLSQQSQIAADADYLKKTEDFFNQNDTALIPPEYSWPAYFAAVYKMTEYDENSLPIADYSCEGLYNLVTKGGYTADTYLYYKYQRYLLNVINQTQKEQYDKALSEYNAAFEKFKNEFNDKTKDITNLWYVSDLNSLPAYTEYGDNAKRLGNISKIFPVFFLLVSALVCLTTMTRMIDENRTQIGTRKALGFNDGAILNHYLFYAVLACLTGSIVGVLIGFTLFPKVIIGTYKMLYLIPQIETPFRWGLALSSIFVTLLCIILTVVVSCTAELFKTSATLLRPKAPRQGKKILLEKISFIWKRLTFIQKVTLRNIFRYKKRMIMTLLGIAGCTALILTAFGLSDSISDIVRLQFNDVMKYDLSVSFTDEQAIRGDIEEYVPYDDYLVVMQKTGTAQTDEGSLEVNIIVPSQTERINDFINLRSRTSHEEYTLADNDIIITEKLAKKLAVEAGDNIDIYLTEDNIRTFYVYAITENYAYHYAYIPQSLYNSTLGEVEFNTALCKIDDDKSDEAAEGILKKGNANAVISQTKTEENFADVLSMLDAVIVVLIVSAGALAFVVLFNLSNINITERKREVATLKVLGFTNKQTGAYIIRENIILSLFGTAAGLLFGRILTGFVVQQAEIDMVMFGRTVYAESFVLAAVITMIFAVAVSLLMNIRIKHINMVESLKSVE